MTRPRKPALLERLEGGDLRSIGESNRLVEEVLKRPARFPTVIAAMMGENRLVRMRAADAAEKITVQRPELLRPFKAEILDLAAHSAEKEMRWHMAQMLPRLELTPAERKRALEILFGYLKDGSSIVRTFSMQALADFAMQDRRLLPAVLPLIERLTETGTAAMKSRGRKLLKGLTPQVHT